MARELGEQVGTSNIPGRGCTLLSAVLHDPTTAAGRGRTYHLLGGVARRTPAPSRLGPIGFARRLRVHLVRGGPGQGMRWD